MNPFVAAGAILIGVVFGGYVFFTRRIIRTLPPLPKKTARSEKKERGESAPPAGSPESPSGAVAEGDRPTTPPPRVE